MPEAVRECGGPLPQALAALVPQGGALWSFVFATAGGAEPVVLAEQHADALMLPASTAKLFTTFALLHALPADLRLETRLRLQLAEVPWVRVAGQGDPSTTSTDLAVMADAVAAQLGARGIASAALAVEEEITFPQRVPDDWSYGDLVESYGAAPGTVNLDHNTLDYVVAPQSEGLLALATWRDRAAESQWQLTSRVATVARGGPRALRQVLPLGGRELVLDGTLPVGGQPHAGRVPAREPALYFGERLANLLRERGIAVTQVRLVEPAVDAASAGELLYTHQSAPLSSLIEHTSHVSDNLYAEALATALVRAVPPGPGEVPGERSVHQRAMAAVADVLTAFGLSPGSFALRDGSGLSRYNLVSARQMATLLWNQHGADNFPAALHTLPMAGEAGTTMARRLVGTPLEGRVHAKTGTLTGVSALAGYLLVPSLPPVVFSVLGNGDLRSGAERRQTIDDMLLTVYRHLRCTR
jgi:D-alanyl-D-alanine carboxypeptidase/D-alanyl-D-alanine-endopeptidase (penicillin-binding protein 4)